MQVDLSDKVEFGQLLATTCELHFKLFDIDFVDEFVNHIEKSLQQLDKENNPTTDEHEKQIRI